MCSIILKKYYEYELVYLVTWKNIAMMLIVQTLLNTATDFYGYLFVACKRIMVPHPEIELKAKNFIRPPLFIDFF